MKRREFLKAQVAFGAAMAAPTILTRVGAQTSTPSVTAGPAVFFPVAKVDAFRARLATEPGLRARWARLIKNADGLAGLKLMSFGDANDIPPGTKIGSPGMGRNANYGVASGQMRKLGLTLGLAWRVTGEERYARKLREALLNFTGFERWVSQARLDEHQPWHSDLNTAGLTMGCAAAYEAIHGMLTPAQRRQIAEGLARVGIVPALNDWALPGRRLHALDSMGHNYYSICCAGAGIGAVALLGDDARALEWVPAVESALEQWISYRGLVLLNKPANFDPTGAYYEGIHYANYACSYYLMFRLALAHARPQSPPARLPQLERMAEFFAHTYYPARGGLLTANFGDSDIDQSAVQVMQMLAANGFSRPLARWYMNQVDADSSDPFSLLYMDDDATDVANSLPRSAIYPGIGWATMRDSWESDATMVAMKSGMYWGHAHADAGSFILFHAGKPLLIDPGYCEYKRPEYVEYYCQSRAHNVVLFNGQGQGNGRDDYLRGSKFQGQIHGLLDGIGVKYVYADATGPMARYLSRNYRHWLWLDGVILVFDDLLAHEAGTFDWLLHYEGEARHKGGDIEVTNGPAKARVTMLFPEDPRVHEEQGLAAYDPEKKAAYLALSTKDASREQKFIVAIVPQPRDAAAPLPKVELLREPLALGVRVHRGDRITDVYLNLQSDGRLMHRNSINTIAGWETDAYLLALTRPAHSAAANLDAVTRYFVSAASYLRKDGQTVLDSLSKVNAVFQPGEQMELLLDGQAKIDAKILSLREPAALQLNGHPTRFEYDSNLKVLRVRSARRHPSVP